MWDLGLTCFPATPRSLVTMISRQRTPSSTNYLWPEPQFHVFLHVDKPHNLIFDLMQPRSSFSNKSTKNVVISLQLAGVFATRCTFNQKLFLGFCLPAPLSSPASQRRWVRWKVHCGRGSQRHSHSATSPPEASCVPGSSKLSCPCSDDLAVGWGAHGLPKRPCSRHQASAWQQETCHCLWLWIHRLTTLKRSWIRRLSGTVFSRRHF